MSQCVSDQWQFRIPDIDDPLVRFRLRIRDTGANNEIEGEVVSVDGSTVDPPIPISEGRCMGLTGKSFMSFKVNMTFNDGTGTVVYKKFLIAGIVRPIDQIAKDAPPGRRLSGHYFETEMASSAEPAMRLAADPGDTGTGGGSTGA
jgi:hypothetical protein